MKKIFSVVVALTMLFALCVPVFAGAAVDALTDADAKAFAQAVVDYNISQGGINLHDENTMVEVSRVGAKAIPVDNLEGDERRAEIAALATAALAADYSLSADEQATFEATALLMLDKAWSEQDLGISTFDPSEVVDNVADGFSDNDLSGLFDTLRNTITDLSDRLSGVFGDAGSTGETPAGSDNTPADSSSDADNTYGGSEPTGDTAIYAVAGVAAVAAVALVLTKKKSK